MNIHAYNFETLAQVEWNYPTTNNTLQSSALSGRFSGLYQEYTEDVDLFISMSMRMSSSSPVSQKYVV